jgi:hypothetical protein
LHPTWTPSQNAVRLEDTVFSGGQAASSHGVLGHWTVAVIPYESTSTPPVQRLALSCVLAVPSPTHVPATPKRASLCWGVAPDGASAWEEPPAGWVTRPETSWDVAKGAWGTKAEPVSTIVADGSRLSVFRVMLDIPWRGALRRRAGVAFKWHLGDEWLGDVVTGGNLSASASFAKVCFSSSEEGTSDEEEEEEEGTAAAAASTDMLAALSHSEAASLSRLPLGAERAVDVQVPLRSPLHAPEPDANVSRAP